MLSGGVGGIISPNNVPTMIYDEGHVFVQVFRGHFTLVCFAHTNLTCAVGPRSLPEGPSIRFLLFLFVIRFLSLFYACCPPTCRTETSLNVCSLFYYWYSLPMSFFHRLFCFGFPPMLSGSSKIFIQTLLTQCTCSVSLSVCLSLSLSVSRVHANSAPFCTSEDTGKHVLQATHPLFFSCMTTLGHRETNMVHSEKVV